MFSYFLSRNQTFFLVLSVFPFLVFFFLLSFFLFLQLFISLYCSFFIDFFYLLFLIARNEIRTLGIKCRNTLENKSWCRFLLWFFEFSIIFFFPPFPSSCSHLISSFSFWFSPFSSSSYRVFCSLSNFLLSFDSHFPLFILVLAI